MHRLSRSLGVVALVYAASLVLGLHAMPTSLWMGSELSTDFYLNHRHAQPRPEDYADRLARPAPIGRLDIEAVSDPAEPSWTCWLPDGTPWCPQYPRSPLPGPAARKARGSRRAFPFSGEHEDKPSREVIFYLTGAGELSANLDRLHFECYVTDGAAAPPCPAFRFEHHDPKGYHAVVAKVPAAATNARVRLGVPEEKWEDTDAAWAWSGDARKLRSKSIRHAGEDWEVGIREVGPKTGGISVVFNCTLEWNGLPRLVAVDAAGNIHEPASPWGEPYPTVAGVRELVGVRVVNSLTFPSLDMAQLKELRLQIQPYVWSEFRNVSLKPEHQTHVEVVNAGTK